MDPSSFASAAASLLAINIQLLSALYGVSDKRTRPLVQRLTYELTQIRTVLQTLEITALSIVEPIFDVSNLRLCLEELKENLLWLSPRVLGVGFQDHEWQWRTINSTGSTQTSKFWLSEMDGADEVAFLRSRLSKLRDCIERSAFRPPDSLQERVPIPPNNSLWQETLDYTQFHELVTSTRTEGTGSWFLEDMTFQRWLGSDRSPRFLYCSGRPGSGKTVLASLVIDSIHDIQRKLTGLNIGLAFFYFSYKKSCPIRGVALALLEQLYLQSSTPPNAIRHLEDRATNGGQISFNEIVSALSAVSKSFRRCYIVLDALDECADDHLQALFYLLNSARDMGSRILVTSRAESVFVETFAKDLRITIRPDKDDIERYATTYFEKSSILSVNPDLSAMVITAIDESALEHSTFLLVKQQVQRFSQMETIREINDGLRLLLLSDTQGDPWSLYRKQILRIRALKPDEGELAQKTLTWIYFAQRPLKASELLDILWSDDPALFPSLYDDEAIDLLVSNCQGLIQDASNITFSHLTVKEFFDLEPRSGRRFLLPESAIVMSCLRYILNLKLDGIKSIDQGQIHAIVAEHPFLLYASRHWGLHLNSTQKPLEREITIESEKLLRDRKRVEFLLQLVLQPHFDVGSNTKQLVRGSALHLVAYFGLAWAVEPISDHYSPRRDNWGRSALHIAAEQGHARCVRELLRLPKNKMLEKVLADSEGKSPWHYAAKTGMIEVVQALLAGGFPLTQDRDNYHITPLEYAATQGSVGVVRVLADEYSMLAHDSEAVKNLEKTLDGALVAALENGKKDVVELLLPSVTPRYEHLIVAIRSGSTAAVRLLLDYIGDINNPAEDGRTALIEAASNGNNAILSFLIRNGAEIQSTESTGRNALAYAVESGNLEAVRVLVDAGAEISTTYIDGQDILVYAASHDMVEIVRYLLEVQSRADLQLAAYYATKKGYEEVVFSLLEAGLDPTIPSETGQSLFEVAREAGFDNIEALLSNAGARVVSSPTDIRRLRSEARQRFSSGTAQTRLTNDDSQYLNKNFDKLVREVVTNRRSTRAARFTTQTKFFSSPTVSKSLRVVLNDREYEVPQAASPRIRQPSNLAAFLLLNTPISTKHLSLGMIVVNPRDPLRAYAPRITEQLADLTRGGNHDTIQYGVNLSGTTDNSAIATVLSTFIGTSKPSTDLERRIVSRRVVRRQLENHDAVVNRVFRNFESEVSDMLKDVREVFVVVGLLVAEDLKTFERSRYGQEVHHVKSLSFEDAGVTTGIDPMVPLPGTGIESHPIPYEGVKVIAVQYRSLRLGGRSSRTNQSWPSTASGTYITLGSYYMGEPSEVVF